MNFEDEHYVRVYTRDTKTWKRWGWEGQTVFMHVWRKLDKAGVLDDIDDPVEDVALMTGLPVDFVAIGLPRVLESDALRHSNGCIIGPKYLEGNTAKKSDAARARESRERRRLVALNESRIVTDSHETNPDVTQEAKREQVTDCDTAVTIRDTLSQNEAKRSTADQPRHSTQSNAEQRMVNAEEEERASEPAATDGPLLSPQAAMAVPIQDRAKRVLAHEHSADYAAPNDWPEVVAIAEAVHKSARWSPPKLGSYSRDSGVRAVVELLATGFTPPELTRAMPRLVKSEWWQERRRTLASLTPNVVRRAVDDSGPVRSEELHPSVQQAIARGRRRLAAMAAAKEAKQCDE